MDKLNELVVKKQQDEERDPKNRIWKKDSLLTNSMQALAFQDKVLFEGVDGVHDELKRTNTRIQSEFNQIKRSRQKKLDMDDWICSYNPDEETWNQFKIKRPQEDPVSSRMHEHGNSFRNDVSIVNHLTTMQSDQQAEAAKQSKQGVNHI